MAVGSISYYLDHLLSGRLVRDTYGTLNSVEYDPSDPEHRNRSHRKYLGMSGEFQLDVFSSIVCTVIFLCLDCTLRIDPLPGHARTGYAGSSQDRLHQSTPPGSWSGSRIPHHTIFRYVREASVDG